MTICSYYGPCAGLKLSREKSLKTLESLCHKIEYRRRPEHQECFGSDECSQEHGWGCYPHTTE